MQDPVSIGLHASGTVAVVRTGSTAEFHIGLSRPIPAFETVTRGTYWKPFRLPAAMRLGAKPPASQELTEFVNDLYVMSGDAGLKLQWHDRNTVIVTVNYGDQPAETVVARITDTLEMLTGVFGWEDPQVEFRTA